MGIMGKHTKGNWTVGVSLVDGMLPIYADNGDRVAYAAEYGEQSETPDAQLANATLIAAAPDLLAALQDAEAVLKFIRPHDKYPDGTVIPGDSEILRTIRAAITQATPQPTE
jgi:hypothetical protein